jgi:high affinity Mn2+ porin
MTNMRFTNYLALMALPIALHAAPTEAESWNAHFQATVLPEAHGGFSAPYTGPQSLRPDPDFETSLTSTLYLGAKVWPGAQAYLDPELSGGSGLSGTQGMAGVLNAETAHVGNPAPQVNLARVYLQQVFSLGGEFETLSSDENQLAGEVSHDRITVTAGKFSLSDFFDGNSYAHDARTQFFNGALVDNVAWDYAADTKGYTWGLVAELRDGSWSLRLGSALLPVEANGPVLDRDISQSRGDNVELEWRHSSALGDGALRWLAYRNQADMGSYKDALAGPQPPDVILSRQEGRIKVGFGLSAEQALGANGGCFMRLGWNDGQTETWAYTEADSTLSLGLQWKGAAWGREKDQWGLAAVANGLSNDHRDYLAAGGSGFLLGDGALNYGPEEIAETYYSISLLPSLAFSFDVQGVQNPGYNRDRGPLVVAGARIHLEL